MISNGNQLLPHLMKCLLYFQHSFTAGFLDTIDILGQQTFINTDLLGHF